MRTPTVDRSVTVHLECGRFKADVHNGEARLGVAWGHPLTVESLGPAKLARPAFAHRLGEYELSCLAKLAAAAVKEAKGGR